MDKQLLYRIGKAKVKIAGTIFFVVEEKFREGEMIGEVIIESIGENFTEHFLQTVEGKIAEEVIFANYLRKHANSSAIINFLGGEKKVAITVGQFWKCLVMARLERKSWYIAYIRDKKGVLWATRARLGKIGIRIEAKPLDDSHFWCPGDVFLSR